MPEHFRDDRMSRFDLPRVLAAASALALLGAATNLHYPPTPLHAAVDDYFGAKVSDPYRWLENGADPTVQRWADAQTALARTTIEATPSYPVYAKRVAALSRTSTVRFGLTLAGGRAIYLRQTPPQAHPVLVARDGLKAPERVLFDPQSTAIESVFVAPDGAKVAFTTQSGGDENETLHVVDAATGDVLADTLAHAGGGTSPSAVGWDAGDGGFVYARWPMLADGRYATSSIELWHHSLGTDPAQDTYVFGRGLSPKAEYALTTSRDGSTLAAFVTAGDGVHAAVFVRTAGSNTFAQVASPADGIGSSATAGGHFVGNRLAVVSVKHNPRGEIVAIPPGKTFALGTILVPASRFVIDDFAPVDGGLIAADIDGGDSAARFVPLNGKPPYAIPLPPQAAITDLAADPVPGGAIVIGYADYRTAGRWVRYDPKGNALRRTGIERRSPGNYSDVVVRRVLVPSLDGSVKIPLEITYLPRARRDGVAPTVLTAYGSYGTITSPHFLGTWLAWLEHGGVYAQAMIRGGGEYGEDWHLTARLATKTLSSDDLAACAQWLGSHGFGDARHIGIEGGSAGGFLMGLALTRDPQRYRAVVSQVGFYDLLREERTPNGAFNTPEFGTVRDPGQFAWMRRQSPYENVIAGRAYPAVLMTTGVNDPRVEPYNSRKMTARLQAASSSGLPILLWQKSGEGHGIGNSFDQRVAEQTQVLTFFDAELRGQ
jgi:prolyl oligopeptidase